MSPGFVGRVCVGAVASERQRNHRSMIEEYYQQLSMANAAVWHHFSVDKVASRCFLYAPPLYSVQTQTRFGTISALVDVAAKNRRLRLSYGEPPLG